MPSGATSASTPVRLRLLLAIQGLDGDPQTARMVEQALQDVSGVIRAYANAATEMAYVEFDPGRTGQSQIEAAIESAGCRVVPAGELQ